VQKLEYIVDMVQCLSAWTVRVAPLVFTKWKQGFRGYVFPAPDTTAILAGEPNELTGDHSGDDSRGDSERCRRRVRERTMTIAVPLESRSFEAISWLCSDECHELDDAGMIARLGSSVRALGLPIDRIGLHLRTLHPQILARSILWSPGEPVQIIDRESIPQLRPQQHDNPLIHVRETREWVVQDSDDGSPLLDWFDVYKGHQIMGFVAAPLTTGQGPAGVAVFATKSRAKFD
jgi:hypothetical protein